MNEELQEPMSKSTYRVVVLEGAEKDRRYYMHDEWAAVGRDPACEISIDDDSLSGRHLNLRRVNGGVQATVFEGVTPVHCNGLPMTSGTSLHNGDILLIGSLHLQFQQVEPLPQYDGRRKPILHHLAYAGVVFIIGIQILTVTLLWFARTDRVAIVQLHEGGEAYGAAGEPVPERLHALSNALSEVESTLYELEEERQNQPVEKVWEGREAVALNEQIERARKEAEKLRSEMVELQPPPQEKVAEALNEEEQNELALLEQMTLAQRAIARGDLEEADRHLAQAETLKPDAPKPFVTRARIFERRGMLEASLAHWDEAMKRVAGTTFHEQATIERRRIARLLKDRSAEKPAPPLADPGPAPAPELVSAPPPAPEPMPEPSPEPEPIPEPLPEPKPPLDSIYEPVPRSAPPKVVSPAVREPPPADLIEEPMQSIRIGSTSRIQFPADDKYEEIRLVSIKLQSRKSAGPLDASKVKVNVRFFDRNPTSDRIHPSRALSSKAGLKIEGDWSSQEVREPNTMYMVKKGARVANQRITGERRQFYGYVVQVYYDGILQDEAAFPSSLLERSRRWM